MGVDFRLGPWGAYSILVMIGMCISNHYADKHVEQIIAFRERTNGGSHRYSSNGHRGNGVNVKQE